MVCFHLLFPPYDDGDGEGHGEEDPLPELGLPDAVLELLVAAAAAPRVQFHRHFEFWAQNWA